MRVLLIFTLISFICLLFALIVFSINICSAQVSFFPYTPLFQPVNPFLPPLFSPMFFPTGTTASVFFAPLTGPVLTPYPVAFPSIRPRSAAATIITLPTAAPAVTGYAPLGTLNLTPSTLVFLILLLTLPE